MAAGIEEFDWMMSGNNQKPWHGLGTVVEGAPTSDEAIKIAKLDWDVIQEPIYMKSGEVLEGYYLNKRTDVNLPLGLVRSRYVIEQNRDCFKFVDDIIQNTQGVEAHYETAGSIFNGKQVFMTVKLPNTKILEDDVEHYLYFLNAHDGSASFTAGITSVRIVCNNTLQMALSNSQRQWKCRHTMSIESKQKEAARELGLAIDYIDAIEKEASELAMKPLREKLFIENMWVRMQALGYGLKGYEKFIDRTFDVLKNKDDLGNHRTTSWGMYNAVADVLSNQIPVKKTKNYDENRLIQSFRGMPILQAAEDILMAA